MRYYFVKQHDQADCGAACMAIILGNYGCKLPISKLRQAIRTDANGSTVYGIIQAAKQYGLQADALQGSFSEFEEACRKNEVTFPLIANVASMEGYSHFIVIYQVRKGRYYIADPAKSKRICRAEDIKKVWLGNIICFSQFENVPQINLLEHSMDKFVNVCLRQRKYFAAIIAVSLLITGISMVGSLIFEFIIDGIYAEDFSKGTIQNSNNQAIDAIILRCISAFLPTLPKLCVTVISFFFFRSILSLLRSSLSATMAKRINQPVMMNFFAYILHVPLSFFNGRRTGDIFSRFQDATGICQGISEIILTIFIDGFLLLVYGVFLLGISWQLFLIVLVSGLLYSAVVLGFKEPLRRNQLDMLEYSAGISSYMKESVDGISTIRLFRSENDVLSKFHQRFQRMINKSYEGSMLAAWQLSITSFISSVSVIMVLWVGYLLCIHNVISVGSLITFYMMTGSFLEPLQGFISLQPRLQSVYVSAERLNDVFEQDQEYHTFSDESSTDLPVIEELKLSNLSFAYGYHLPVLENASFTLHRGERVAVLGKNGCGKTTFANILMGLYPLENAEFKINSNIVTPEEYDRYGEKFAYIPQESFFYSESILENMLYGIGTKQISEERITEVIRQCGLMEYVNSLPQGVWTCMEENASNLSAGTKQKLAIARALLREPEILIMDEATSNIDVESEQEIQKVLDQLGDRITIINISHKIHDLCDYDVVYRIEQAQLILCKEN